MTDTLLIFDGSSLAYRSFYAFINNPLRSSKGLNTSGIYGFVKSLLKTINKLKPKYAVCAFDLPKPTFRHIEYKEYKAQRKKMPEELSLQIPYIKEITENYGIKILEIEGYEADDIIFTVGRYGSRENLDVIIFTFDKDIMQLVCDNIKILNMHSKGEEWFDKEKILEKFGVKPVYIPTLLSLIGDATDNIKGLKGIGKKKAIELIDRFGDIENILKNLTNIPDESLKTLLLENREEILSNYNLIKMKEIPFDIDIESLIIKPKNTKRLKEIFRELEFYSFLKELDEGDIKIIEGDVSGEEIFITFFGDKFFISDGNKVQLTEKEQALSKIDNADFIITDEIKLLSTRLGYYPEKKIIELGIIDYLLFPNDRTHNILKIVSRRKGIALGQKEEEYKVASTYGYKLKKECLDELKEKEMLNLYQHIELPLSRVLFNMEHRGIKFDIPFLKELSDKICRKLKEYEEKIYEIAGEEFNIRSPKQLSYILFEKLKIKPMKRRKNHFSTDFETLESLARNYEIARILIDYRELEKLRNSYTDALPNIVDNKTGRIHCSFHQTIAATGRITTSEPNLQTLPIRTNIGKEIRKALIPDEGYEIMSCDYSQIELRILAHFSEDKNLVKAFKEGRDIHRETASVIFNYPENITDEMRRVAKVVNFGLIYGMSVYGLSKELDITVEEANLFITSYFNQFIGVQEWIEKIVSQAKKFGYVKTLFGRRRDIPELLTKGMEDYGKRIAINTPIQGTAADIIKMGMIKCDEFLKDFKSKMLLQIHDELLFEVKVEEKEIISEKIKNIMETVFPLNVPLIVDVKFGRNWAEAH